MEKSKVMSGYEKIYDDGYKAGRASVVLPHPCDGELYKDWTPSDYFAKIAEEHLEVIDAYKAIKAGKCLAKEGLEHFFKECTDLIVATTGLMNYFGCDEEMRQKYMQEINESNAKRDGGKRFAKPQQLKVKMKNGGLIWSSTHDIDKKQEEEKPKHDEEDLEIGDVVMVDCVSGEKEAVVLGKSKAYPEEYDISINGYCFAVPRRCMKKVEK